MNNDPSRPGYITPIPTFHSTQSTVFIPPIFTKIPDELVLWLIKDLPEEALQSILAGSAFKEQAKGFRTKSLVAEKAPALLLAEFHKNVSFRLYIGNIWKKRNREDVTVLRGISAKEMAQNYGSFVKRFGAGAVFWHCTLSDNMILQKTSFNIVKLMQTGAVSSAENYGGGPDDEVKRLKKDLETNRALNARLEEQVAADSNLIRSLKNETEALRQESRQLEIALAHEKQNVRLLSEKIAEADKKIASLSSAGQAISAIEKAKRLKEHDLKTALNTVEELEARLKSIEKEKSVLLALRAETQKTISLLFKYLSAGTRTENACAKTAAVRNLLIISEKKELPADYYKFAASAGFAVNYHESFARDIKLENKCSKCDKVLLLFSKWEEVEKHTDLTGYLLKNSLDFLVLPFMRPETLFSFLKTL